MKDDQPHKTLKLNQINPRLPALYQACADYMGVDRDKLILILMRPLVQQLADEMVKTAPAMMDVDTIEALEHAIEDIFPQPVEKPGGGVTWG